MFAVPGWSVSSALLKRDADPDSSKSSKKKRKRRQQQEEAQIADAISSNSLDLANPQLPSKNKPSAAEDGPPSSKKHKVSKEQQSSKSPDGARGEKKSSRPEDKPAANKKLKNKETAAIVDKLPPEPPSESAKLTPLQSAMRQKLISARFRHLNEVLYTSPSDHASTLFQDNPTFFEEYHSGFRQQVSTWPENPVDGFVRELQSRGKIHFKQKSEAAGQPLPRSGGVCRVADLGCGDAKLSLQMEKAKSKARIEVMSFDLQAPNSRITKADIANLSLDSGSVNVAIFCLALMGSNWIDFVEEAYRILHWKGELWVAEIKSRFGKVKSQRVEHSVGNRKRKQQPSKEDQQRMKDQESRHENEQLATEVDGVQAKDETDVSAFVSVLRRRGFALQDEQIIKESPIDLSNKMFVRMKFVKSLPALTGKNTGKGDRKKPAFISDEKPEQDEASVLKPCLYKIR